MRIETPNSRATDPESSHLAGEAITRSGRRASNMKKIVSFVKSNPGLTSKEIAVAMDDDFIDRYEVSRRLADASGVSVKKGPARNCTACTGMKLCVTWYPMGVV